MTDNKDKNTNPNNNLTTDHPEVTEYRKILEYYFENDKVDVEQMLKQPKEDLKIFIEREIKPNWRNCSQSVNLHKELSDNKFVKPLSYKKLMKEMFREKRTSKEIKENHKKISPVACSVP